MNVRSIFILLFSIGVSSFTFSQEVNIDPEIKKILNIQRTSTAPKIDGVLDDAVWGKR